MKTIKIRYTGVIPVRIPGVTKKGYIRHNDEVDVPEEIANNLGRDDFWEVITDEPVLSPVNDTVMIIPDEPHQKISNEKKRRKGIKEKEEDKK